MPEGFSEYSNVQNCQKNGNRLDVVSGGELYTAIQAGLSPLNYVARSNKSVDEIKMAIDAGFGRSQ
jgi:diaminopimelate decarboxylase